MARESPRLQRGASSPRRPVSSGLVEGFGAAGGAHVAAGDAGAVAGTLAAEAVAPAVAWLPLALAMLLTRIITKPLRKFFKEVSVMVCLKNRDTVVCDEKTGVSTAPPVGMTVGQVTNKN